MQDFIALKLAAKEQLVKSDFEESFRGPMQCEYLMAGL